MKLDISIPVVAAALLCCTSISCGDRGRIETQTSGPAAPATIRFTKISQTEGGFTGELADYDGFGFSVASVGDINGDGTIDLAVGAPWDEDPDTLFVHGSVWILFMTADLTVRSQIKIAPGVSGFGRGLPDVSGFGSSVAGAGDIDGDGIPDLAVGAPDVLTTPTGSTWNLLLNRDGTVKRARQLVPATFGSAKQWERTARFGQAVAGIGDVNGDGIPDLAIADNDPGYGPDNDSPSGIHIVLLDESGDAKTATPVSGLYPMSYSLTAPGDVDGDGVVDLIASSTTQHLVLLNADGSTKDTHDISEPSSDNPPTRDGLERIVAVAGDLDGDRVPELAALVRTGWRRQPYELLIQYFDGDGLFRSVRTLRSPPYISPRSLAGLGDVERNGSAPLALGAPGDDDGGRDRGAVWIVWPGDLSAPTTSTTMSSIDTTSTSTTTCPPDLCSGDDDASLWEVEVFLGESRALGALQFDIVYSAAQGSFVGFANRIECRVNPDLSVYAAFNDHKHARPPSLTAGLISTDGFTGPQSLITCAFRTRRNDVMPENLEMELRLIVATQPNMRDTDAPLSLVVRRATQ